MRKQALGARGPRLSREYLRDLSRPLATSNLQREKAYNSTTTDDTSFEKKLQGKSLYLGVLLPRISCTFPFLPHRNPQQYSRLSIHNSKESQGPAHDCSCYHSKWNYPVLGLRSRSERYSQRNHYSRSTQASLR